LRGKNILLCVIFYDFNYYSCLETQFVIGNEFWEVNLPRIIFLLIFEYILVGILKRTIGIFQNSHCFADCPWLTLRSLRPNKAQAFPTLCTAYARLQLRFIYSCMSNNAQLDLGFGSRGKMCQKCLGFWTQPDTKGLELKVFTKLAYLVDIFGHFNLLHLGLQGKAANEFIWRIKLKQW